MLQPEFVVEFFQGYLRGDGIGVLVALKFAIFGSGPKVVNDELRGACCAQLVVSDSELDGLPAARSARRTVAF